MKRANKFGAKPCTITHAGKEVRCASRAEAKRFGELILLLRAGEISELEFHPKFALYATRGFGPGRYCLGHYIGDAQYMRGGILTVEDVKGVATPVFKLKARIFQANYPDIRFSVVRARA